MSECLSGLAPELTGGGEKSFGENCEKNVGNLDVGAARFPTHSLARRIRQRDNTPGAWPRDPKIQIGRSTPTTGDRTDPVVGASLSEGETKH
jgi:hypothetical protein